MRSLGPTEAQQIADKLSAEIEEGRKHTQAIVRWQGKIVGKYGIRRGSRETSHDFIPRQLSITFREALNLARCPLSREEYFELLRSRGKLLS
jgi:hypothetical protein